jgi:hypothetical protein
MNIHQQASDYQQSNNILISSYANTNLTCMNIGEDPALYDSSYSSMDPQNKENYCCNIVIDKNLRKANNNIQESVEQIIPNNKNSSLRTNN